jgi:MFS family permease
MFNRKNVILGTCFGWSMATYLSSFALTFNQIFILRCLKGLFMAVSGPCSYSLITDWVPPENRLTAYSIYSLGVQFGGPFASFNSQLIDWLGWRATFQYNALIGFIILGLCIVIFDEPEKGRFDIAHSVVNNPEESMKNDSIGYALSEAPTRKRLDIKQ